jgi:translation initiation factor IF-1
VGPNQTMKGVISVNSRSFAAEVVELLPNAAYRLILENQQEVLAHTAGAVVTNFVRLRPGDKVEVEISPHDHTRGRITKLLRKP